METVKIKSVTASQLAQMHAMECAKTDIPYSREILLDCVENLDTFVCLEEDEILGFLTMNPRSKKYLGGSIYVVNLLVGAAYRQKGIAKHLFYAAYQYYAPNQNGRMVTLDVRNGNTPALALYRKTGFQPVDVQTQNDGEYIVMSVPFEIWGQNLNRAIE